MYPTNKEYLFGTLGLLLIAAGALALFLFLEGRQTLTFEQSPETESPAMPEDEQPSFMEISSHEDCGSECLAYQGDLEKYSYCRTVCGFTSEEGIEKPSVSSDPVLTRDYEFRDSAIRERNIQKCRQIQDANIRDTCQARVAEDLLEE